MLLALTLLFFLTRVLQVLTSTYRYYAYLPLEHSLTSYFTIVVLLFSKFTHCNSKENPTRIKSSNSWLKLYLLSNILTDYKVVIVKQRALSGPIQLFVVTNIVSFIENNFCNFSLGSLGILLENHVCSLDSQARFCVTVIIALFNDSRMVKKCNTVDGSLVVSLFCKSIAVDLFFGAG